MHILALLLVDAELHHILRQRRIHAPLLQVRLEGLLQAGVQVAEGGAAIALVQRWRLGCAGVSAEQDPLPRSGARRRPA